MTRLDPEVLFTLLRSHLPGDVCEHVLVVGSLAAAMSHHETLGQRGVNTKDCDVIIHPAGALPEATKLAARLFEAGWRPLARCTPGANDAAVDELSVIRLNPPTSDAYFVELLGLPTSSQAEARLMTRFEVNGGWYVLPSFRFMALLSRGPLTHQTGISYASPSMMALANLLAHRELGTARVSEAIVGRNPLRSAKDLGRVLALARLEKTRERVEAWALDWRAALETCFPAEWRALATHAGDGLRALLADQAALADAHHTAVVGLLSGLGVTVSQLSAVGEQVLVDAIAPLAAAAQDG